MLHYDIVEGERLLELLKGDPLTSFQAKILLENYYVNGKLKRAWRKLVA